MRVEMASGKCYQFSNNRDLAKFHLFVVPKLIAAGDKVVGQMPRLEMTDEVNRLAKINQRIRANKARRSADTPPFDDGIPF